MAADWEKLAAEWEGHPVGLVAEVDCTDEEGGGQSLCEDFKVEGFPTIMYGDPQGPEPYEGGRDYESLSAFAKEHLSTAVCSVSNLDPCSEEQKTMILELQKKSKEDLEKITTDVETKLHEMHDKYEKDLEALNEQYEQMTTDLHKANDDVKKSNNYKLVKQILLQMNSKVEDKEEL
jgi:Thioredoxin